MRRAINLHGDAFFNPQSVGAGAQAVQAGAAVERLAAARSAPLLLAGCADGRVQLFDLRDPRGAAATLQAPSASPLVRRRPPGTARDAGRCARAAAALRAARTRAGSQAEQSRAEQSRAEQSRAEQSRAEQSRAEQSRAEQCRAPTAGWMWRRVLRGSGGAQVGLVAEAGGAAHQAVAGTAAGELHFLDYRMAAAPPAPPPTPPSPGGTPWGGPGGVAGAGGEGRARPAARMGVWKTVAASARGAMLTGLVAHEHAPLLATATAMHVRSPTLPLPWRPKHDPQPPGAALQALRAARGSPQTARRPLRGRPGCAARLKALRAPGCPLRSSAARRAALQCEARAARLCGQGCRRCHPVKYLHD